jgi:hypothetical protein
VALPEGRFAAGSPDRRLLVLDADVPNAFVHTTATRAWLSNVRYRFIYRPLSDIFIVVNETRCPGERPRRALILKWTAPRVLTEGRARFH